MRPYKNGIFVFSASLVADYLIPDFKYKFTFKFLIV